jgi:hypothetical protein
MRLQAMSAALAAGLLITSSAVAQANPAVPMAVIEDSAAQMCGVIDGNPSDEGVIEGIGLAFGRGLDGIDVALVTLVAIHHTCPQHEPLISGVLDPLAAEQLCTEPL